MLALLRAQVTSADLLPPAYGKFRPLLADGLCFFLERLSAARLDAIFLGQQRMPLTSSVAERLAALLHYVPTMHKLGQVMGRDRRLNVEFRNQLHQLETLEPRTPRPSILRLLEREFAGWKKAGIELGSQALAEGSVAVVMPFTWRCAPKTEPVAGVFKLLKPGIEDRLAEELPIWAALADFLEDECERYRLPQLDYRETFETVQDLLLHEIRLDEEQAHLVEAAEEYRGLDSVAIPALLPFGTPRLTAMERLDGVTLSEVLRGSAQNCASSERRAEDRAVKKTEASATLELAPLIAEALIARPVFSCRPAALFHADPHAGNLFATEQGRLGVLDWSLAGRLEKNERIELVQLLLGALTLDAARIEDAVQTLSAHSARPAALQELISASVGKLRSGWAPRAAWLTNLLDEVAVKARARLPRDLLLFRKSLLTLEGVLADAVFSDATAAQTLIDQALLGRLFRQLTEEWPKRFSQPANSRALSTHLSTVDLISLFCSGPATVARYWLGIWGALSA
jgi:ubiquinone biosynthesis protein